MIVCFQYQVISFVNKFEPFTVFAKDMNDFQSKYLLGVDTMCYAVCGWRVKKFDLFSEMNKLIMDVEKMKINSYNKLMNNE